MNQKTLEPKKKEEESAKKQAQRAQLEKFGLSSELIDALFQMKPVPVSPSDAEELLQHMLRDPKAAKEFEAFLRDR